MSIYCVANNINRNVYMYLNTRIFPTTGYARVLLFMFIWRKQGGTGTGCLFQFTYCVIWPLKVVFTYNSLTINREHLGQASLISIKVHFQDLGKNVFLKRKYFTFFSKFET